MRYTRRMAAEPHGPKTVRFRCTQCGDCCREPGLVELDYAELTAVASASNLSISDFKTTYDVRWEAESGQFELPGPNGCPLLSTEGRCTVEAVKPSQCRTYPFWPENLASKEAWQAASTKCEGIDDPQGKVYDAETLQQIARARRGT